MQKSDVFISKYIKGEDIGDNEVRVTIDNVVSEEVQEGEKHKPVMYFTGKQKGMVINSGNWDALAYAYGDESDEWIGKPAILYTVIGTFQGKTSPWLRIKAPPKRHAAPKPAAPKPAADSENPAEGMGDYLNDDLPF